MRPVNVAQRIVVLVGSAAGLLVVGQWLTTRGQALGWSAYSPVTGSAPPLGLPPWARMLIWVGLALAWSGTALWLLRTRSR